MSRRHVIAAVIGAAALTTTSIVATLPRHDTPTVDAAANRFDPLPEPRRLLDTRSGSTTWDGEQEGVGAIVGGRVLRLPVGGRAGLDADPGAVVVNIAAIEPDDQGFVTAYSCDGARPTTSNLNYRSGEVVSGMTIVPVASDGAICLFTRTTVDLAVDAIGAFGADAFEPLLPAERLLDTRPGESTVDDRFVGAGSLGDGDTIEVELAGRGSLPDTPGPLLISIAAIATANGFVTAWGCAGDRPATSNVNVVAAATVSNTAIVDVGSDGRLCLFVRGRAHLVVDVVGQFADGAVTVLPEAARLLDTRPEWPSVDGEVDNTGLRRGTATLRVPVAARGGVPTGAAAAVVNITAVDPRSRGFVTVHPPADDTPLASNLNHPAGRNVGNLAIVPLDVNGEICAYNRATTHLVIDVVAYLPGPAPGAAAAICPGQTLFPHWRMVALYGTDDEPVLGALGEQPPDEAAARVEAVVGPWRAASERPIMPAFEVIATIAWAAPGPSGLYRGRSSPELIQRYLDAARRHGMYVILDIQPGRSDFLTEAKVYAQFLREPDVGLALDPEWRTEAPARPGGGYVGQVDAAEVNEVADWLAGIVAEEDLPEKLLIVHQFQTRMITNRDQLREPEGIALNIHMDGFGTRSQKLNTYSFIHVDPPWSNGFKLFYDEDIDIFTAADVLDGTVDPAPDLITYQ